MSELDKLRLQIDKLDKDLIDILVERIKATEQVCEYKKAHALPARDSGRWQELKEIHKKACEERGLDYGLIEPIFEHIHEHVLKHVHKDLK